MTFLFDFSRLTPSQTALSSLKELVYKAIVLQVQHKVPSQFETPLVRWGDIVGNKMHKAFPLPVIEFPLAEEVPTVSEESSHCQKKRDATAKRIALLVIEFGDSYEVPASTETIETASGGTGKKTGRTVTVTTEDMQKRKNDFMNIEIKQDDLNQKFLTSLAIEWFMHTIVWRNRSDLDTMSLDDLYNHLKVYESKVQKKLEPNSQNIAFISSAKHNRGNEDVNTTSVSTTSTNVPNASANNGVASISQDTTCAYIASQSSGSQIKFEDINKIDEDDMEEMDIKWSMALLSMRADKFWKKTGKKISIQGSDVAGFDKSKVECFNYHKMGHFARECRAPRSQDRGRRDNYRQGSKVKEQAPKALMAINRVGWDWSYMENDEENHALVADEEAPTEFALMANTSAESKVFDNSLCSKDCKKNNDSLNSKITDLTDKLFDAKNMIYHYKLGLAQVESRLVEHKEREIKYCEKIRGLELDVKFNSNKFECIAKELETLKKEKEGIDGKLEGLRYIVVPPHPAQIYSSPKKDLSWTGLPEFADDTVTDYSRPSPTMESTSDKTETPKKPPVKYAEQYRKPNKKPNVRGNQRNWNNLKSHQLGPNFVMKKNACFNCGDFNHLAYDYRKRVKKGTSRSQNDIYKSFTHRPVVHRPYRPLVKPIRSNMNAARPNKTSFNKQAHSCANRPIQRTSAVRSQFRAPWVSTANRNFPPISRKFSTVSRNFPTVNRKFPTANRKVSTSGTKFSTADMGKKGKAGSSQNNIDDKGYWDSGCSRHMTGNISYLSDYEPFDGGYVSFGQGGCKITGKGTIKTGKLKFENVYFVKDLKYNLFSVSQICDNKNSVMFTNSECIVLGRDFKLLDDANILLRTPRQHNMYSIDLNNILPHKDLTCLVAKASADEVLVNKSQNKTPYELFNGRTPAIGFLKPFGCHVMILNTLDNLGKFEAKGDECYFIRYSMSSKAFRVFNKRTRRVEENLHVEFLENKAIEKGAGPNWLFDIDSLNKSMNYVPVDAGTNSTNLSGTKDATNQEVKKNVSSLRYIALPNWVHDALLESSSSKPQDDCSTDVPKSTGNLNLTASTTYPLADQLKTLTVESPIPTVSSLVLIACFNDSLEPISDARLISKRVANQVETPSLDNI
uniref:Ribonuclease H-like domain-containing protein n=1 Tax=Tanacetum cinerariifolium TaxID=118510 RepID=A0A6L2P2U1_TANCI|nr:ribonuclease H-like domain-containing protein [Tanacetum cinerariifolium]